MTLNDHTCGKDGHDRVEVTEWQVDDGHKECPVDIHHSELEIGGHQDSGYQTKSTWLQIPLLDKYVHYVNRSICPK